MGDIRTISKSEVEKHSSPESTWIVMNNKVYDITKFLQEHPGGEEVLNEMAGKDASVEFIDVGHSKDAKEMAEEYVIGKLAEGESSASTSKDANSAEKKVTSPGNGWKDILLSPTWSNFLIPAMERIGKYCKAIRREYEDEGINSSVSGKIRRKLLDIMEELETKDDYDTCMNALCLIWKYAYHQPVTLLRSCGDNEGLSMMVSIFCGEFQTKLSTNPRMAAYYNLYLGDLYRYISHEVQSKTLSRLYYQKAVEADPELGQAFNQLGLQQTNLIALRYYILAMAAQKPFVAAVDNALRCIAESDFGVAGQLVEDLLSSYSKSRFTTICEHWMDEMKEREENTENLLEDADLPLQIQTLSFSCKLIVERNGDECFVRFCSLMCQTLKSLVEKVSLIDDEVLPQSRRRRVSETSEDSDVDEDFRSGDTCGVVRVQLWPLAVASEWLMIVWQILQDIKDRGGPVPIALFESMESLFSLVIERLNGNLEVLKSSDMDQETAWLLDGPIVALDNQSLSVARGQTMYCAQRWCSAENSPVEFVDYFRKRLRTSQKAQPGLLKRMAELRINNLEESEDRSWLPVYIVLDYSVLEHHLDRLPPIINSGDVIPVVPSYVLARLDKMKSSGPTIRSAMRQIARWQERDAVRVVDADSSRELCQKLAASRGEHTAVVGVAMIVTNLEAHHNLRIPGVTIYHVESFCERWHKGRR